MIGSRRMFLALCATVPALWVQPAPAHAQLSSSEPKAGSTIAVAPMSVKLTFSEQIELAFSGASIAGSDGKPVATGPAVLDPSNPAVQFVPITVGMAAGTLTVEWHNLSADGHKLKGKFTFTLKS